VTPSPYFQDTRASYQAELDDLRTDSEGRDVLQRRLKDKRAGFRSVVAMMDTDPLMIAPAFHGAFAFPAGAVPAIEEVLAGEFGDYPPWAAIAPAVGIADWAVPLVRLALQQPLGEEFMALVVGLEYAGARQPGHGDAEAAPERESDGDEQDEEVLGEDFLEQQGFDRRTPQ
jgi:hypothetical protein